MKKAIRLLSLLMVLMVVFTTVGVFATWYYATNPAASVSKILPVRLYSWVELPDQSIDIANKFLNVLNNEEGCNVTIKGTTYTDTYEALLAAFENSATVKKGNKTTTLHNDSYIGTMQSNGDDVAAVRTLFGDSLTAEEEASEDYSLMLKRDPLDQNSVTGISYYMHGDHNWVDENQFYAGCEMVLFSTNWQSDENAPSGYVIVYATVYTRYPLTDASGKYVYDLDENGNIQYYTYTNAYGQTITTSYPIYQYGEWKKISGDDAFVGYAMVVDYSTADATRSFATGTWVSSFAYNSAPTGSSLSQVIQALPAAGS